MIETYAIYVSDLKYVNIICMVFTMIESYAIYFKDLKQCLPGGTA